MEIMNDRYSITELSHRLSITDHTLRYYEKEFNLKVPKDSRGRRFYTPELANIMFQIKNMRSEGLEIKAIKKILQDESIVPEPPPVVTENNTESALVPAESLKNGTEIKLYFDEFKEQILLNVSAEVSSAREHLIREITKSKLELGACVENNFRKMESKMEKHFQDVDRALENWREKKRENPVKRLFNGLIR